jgi:cytochrome P450
VDESEAEEWIGWGIHVFRDAQAGEIPGQAFESYLKDKLESAKANPGDDFFSALMTADLDGRTLNLEEAMGFANLAFAGGRDTVIHTISSVIAYLSRHKEAFAYLRENPKHIVSASEEFFRVISPLTHIGRVCPVKTEVHGMPVEEKGRVSLCWASANFDEAAFDSPDEVRLDRRPNPHVAFGAGVHLCLGAAHARLIVRALLSRLSEKVDQIKLLEAEEHVENEERYRRSVGYESLAVQFLKR